MSKKLPFVKSDIPRDLRMFLDRVRELISGSGSDRLISLDDLTSAGLAGSNSSGDLVAPAQPFVASPPAPTNVTATAAIRTIFVEWDAPAYSGHAYAEVWGASTNSLAAAVLLGMSPGGIYVDDTGPSTTRFYWIRFSNTNDVKGPYNATSGTSATTGPEVDYLLGQLAGEITTTELAASLNNRINLIDGSASTPGTIPNQLAFLQGQVDAITTYPEYDNATTYAAEDIVKYDGGLYKAISATTGNLPTNATYWLKIGDYSSLADVVAAHTAEIATLTTDLGGEVTARETLATQMRGTYTGTDLALVTSGLIFSERSARTTADAAFAGSILALETTVNSPTTGLVATRATLINDYSTTSTVNTAIANSKTALRAYTDVSASRTFRQVSAPTKRGVDADTTLDIPLQTGDVWIDTDDQNKLYQWSGAAWAYSPDGAITGSVSALTATLTNDYLTQTDTENAIAQSATYLRAYADIQSKVFRQTNEPLKRGVDPETAVDIALEVGDVWYDTNDSNKLYLWSGTAWVYSPDGVITGSVSTVDARVTTVENAKIGYCTIGGLATDNTNKTSCEAAGGVWNVGIPMATAVKQVSISDGTDSATLETRATAQKTLNDGLKLQYTIKLDVNNYVAGYGIYSDSVGNSEFIANVNRFAVTTPQTSIEIRANNTAYAIGNVARLVGADAKTLVCKVNGVTAAAAPTIGAIGTMVVDGTVVWQVASRVPFAVQAIPTQINGQDVPAGMYLDAAYILNSTIQNAQIANLAVDNAKIANLSVGKLTAGSITADEYIQSTGYITGSQGWRVDGNGFAEFAAAAIRGQLTAAQIDSRNLSIKDSAGNIILAAGSPLATTNISGLGTLASANTVNWNTQITNIPGFQQFAFLNTITSANIGTYIQSAAIGEAYIGNLAVSTLKIQDRAVSTTRYNVFDYSPPQGPSTLTALTDYTASVENSGDYIIILSMSRAQYISDFVYGSSTIIQEFELLIDGVRSVYGINAFGDTAVPVNFGTRVQNLSAGTHNFQFRYRYTGSNVTLTGSGITQLRVYLFGAYK